MQKLLFVCSRNLWRSPTAADLFVGSQSYEARSAGTEPSARRRVNEALLRWADLIFVMEKRHCERLWQRFPEALHGKRVGVLDIPDQYSYGDPELVQLLRLSLLPYLRLEPASGSSSLEPAE
ncbi:MAG: hypothetical protein SFU83_20465 [Meiothermus sp.]|nr:hypothetical protein [Meiothermus sp.]